MTGLRRLLITGVAAVAVSGIASADEIISFSGTVATQLTELSNKNVQLTSWNPGGTGGFNAVASDSSSYASTQPGFTTGVTMASLSTPGVVYTLQAYDVLVQSTVSGSFSVTATGSTSANGSVHLDSYTAASLGSTMTALTSANDPSNDFFTEDAPPPGGGPDPKSSSIAVTNLPQGSTQGPFTFSKTQGQDYGQFLASNTSSSYDAITAGTGGLTVSGTSPLNFYFSTLTGVDINLTTGNISNTQTTSVSELVTVVYDFTTSSSSSVTPEPTTMVLFGSALVGLGLLRKRVRR